MKSINSLLCAALVSVLFALSSCYESNAPGIDIPDSVYHKETSNTVTLGEITIPQKYTYTVSTNANTSLNVWINGSRSASISKSSSFTDEADINSEITVKVAVASSSTGYSTETFTKTIRLDYNGKVIEFDIPKIASGTTTTLASNALATAEKEGVAVIENNASNQKMLYDNNTIARLSLDKNALSGIKSNAELSIAAERASMTAPVQDTTSVEEWFDVMTIICTPSEQKLSSKAKVEVSNDFLEKGMEFRCKEISGSECSINSDGTYSMNINELKSYTIQCKVKVEQTNDSTKETTQGNIIVPYNSTKAIAYTVKSGYNCAYSANEFINKYLNDKFGKYTDTAKRYVKISNSDADAKVSYSNTQKIYNYRVSFGSLVVLVTVYGQNEITIDKNSAVKAN